jgi:hypothetical protein
VKGETTNRIREQAEAYATEHAGKQAQPIANNLDRGYLNVLQAALRFAYLAGADAGYTAAKAEERAP